jgi:hypothetical protein
VSGLKKLGAIGAAIYTVSAIAGYLLPTPHVYAHEYAFVYGPAGAFAGYGLAHLILKRSEQWPVWRLAAIALIAVLGAVVCGTLYLELYYANRSPEFAERTMHAIFYGFAFAFLFFCARWAGLLLSEKSSDNK